ncbi:hypothetical protein APR08_006209 [Nocardia amikacinitolerans]|nr:hypothetical protein [Nocardia amikacinitolerans]
MLQEGEVFAWKAPSTSTWKVCGNGGAKRRSRELLGRLAAFG